MLVVVYFTVSLKYAWIMNGSVHFDRVDFFELFED